jgi:hypothetical protein
MMHLWLRSLVVVGPLLLGCNSSSAIAASPPSLQGPAVPSSFDRMFDGQCLSNKIFIVPPPFAPPLAPDGAIAQPCSNAIAFNFSNGAMAVSSGAKFGVLALLLYDPPYSSASVPRMRLQPSALVHPRQLAWDNSGNLWVADDTADNVFEFVPPFSASSAPAATNTLAEHPAGLAINPDASLMFIGDIGGSTTCEGTPCRVFVVPAPYTGGARATLEFGDSSPAALAVDQLGRLFVGFGSGSLENVIKVYAPPFVNGETAEYTLTVGSPVKSLAFDSSRNLYAQLYRSGGVDVFYGPISSSRSAPAVVLGCPQGATSCGDTNWAGLAFGP